MVGPLVRKCAESFYVDKFFAGADGFNDRGAMSGDLMRAEAVRAMAENAKEISILTESDKVSRTGVVTLLPYSVIGTIYTDSRIEDAMFVSLREMEINVCLAD